MRGILTGLGVALEAQHNLWRTVPSRSHVFGHISSILLRIDGETSSQTKIANLELAVGVHKQVSGLEIAMEHIGRVDVFQAAQDLVDEGLEVGVGKRLAGSDDSGQIALHQLCEPVSVCLCWWDCSSCLRIGNTR
jgi:hypothetical protein